MIGWLIEALVASAVLMVLVLLLRAPVRRAFGPDVAYALWALPLLRLLLPPLPASWREAATAPIAAAGQTITIYVAEPLGLASATTDTDQLALLVPILVALWVAGALAFLAWHTAQHLRFCRRMLTHQIRGSEIDGGIHLIETGAANGPLAFGILRKYVAFPRDFIERYDQEERDLALAHELGHHARGDLFANWLALGVLALHWFNPIAWRAFRAFRADQEIANDARVLAGLSAIARHSYACAIVKSAHGGAVSAACHLHTIDDLKGRLKMLTTNKTSRGRMIGGAAAVAILTLAALGLTASGTQAAASVRDGVERATGVNWDKDVDWAAFNAAPPALAVGAAAPTAAELPVPPQEAELPEPPVPPAPPQQVGKDRQVTTSTTTHSDGKRIDRREVTTIRTTGDDGKTVSNVKIVTRDKDGKEHVQNWTMPEISSRDCAGQAGDKEVVINEVTDGKRRIVICNNRIQAAAARGAALAGNNAEIRRTALEGALTGLRAARSTIQNNAGMTNDQRRDALKGIEQGLAEVRSQLDRGD
jgi:bla regulator protein BlaR1